MVHCPRRIYQYQQFGYSFSTVEQLLHAMGGDGFLTLANQTLEEAMLGEGFSQVFLNNIVAPITRVNYGQSVRVNGFVGMPLPLHHTRLREGSSCFNCGLCDIAMWVGPLRLLRHLPGGEG